MIERNYETKFSIMMFENWVPNNSMTFLIKFVENLDYDDAYPVASHLIIVKVIVEK